MIELNRVYCGDCLELMKHIDDNSINLTVTSPPYDNLRTYNGYDFNFDAIAEQLYRVTKSGGVVVWVVGDATINGSETGTSFEQALAFKRLGFNLHDTMIYRTNKQPMNDRRYQACFEYMFVFSKGYLETFNPIMEISVTAGQIDRSSKYYNPDGKKKERHNKGPRKEYRVKESIWTIPSCHANNEHPAVFPEQLAKDHILSWSNPGDVVLDPMCGSGTTCKMATLNDRNFIGIDVSSDYCAIAERRIKEAQAQCKLKLV